MKHESPPENRKRNSHRKGSSAKTPAGHRRNQSERLFSFRTPNHLNLCVPRRFRVPQIIEKIEVTTKDAKGTKDKTRKSSVFICVHPWLFFFASFLSTLSRLSWFHPFGCGSRLRQVFRGQNLQKENRSRNAENAEAAEVFIFSAISATSAFSFLLSNIFLSSSRRR
jgi:hypothetical protein